MKKNLPTKKNIGAVENLLFISQILERTFERGCEARMVQIDFSVVFDIENYTA